MIGVYVGEFSYTGSKINTKISKIKRRIPVTAKKSSSIDEVIKKLDNRYRLVPYIIKYFPGWRL